MAKLVNDETHILLVKYMDNKDKIKSMEMENQKLLEKIGEAEDLIFNYKNEYRTISIGKPEGSWVYYRKIDVVKNAKTSERHKMFYGILR